MRAVVPKILAALFPRRCPVCGEFTNSASPRLCGQCAEALAEEHALLCRACQRKAPECTCKTESVSHNSVPVITSGFYIPDKPGAVSSRLVFALKHSADDAAAHVLARDLAGTILKEFLPTGEDVRTWTITNVPRSVSGYEKNGFDQAQRLAKLCARYCGTRYKRIFRRHGGDTQKELTAKDRRANAVASLRLRHPRRAYTGKYIVIDDVLTTGATLGKCADLLRIRGAESVCIAAALKTVSRPSEQELWYAQTGKNSQ